MKNLKQELESYADILLQNFCLTAEMYEDVMKRIYSNSNAQAESPTVGDNEAKEKKCVICGNKLNELEINGDNLCDRCWFKNFEHF